MKRNLKSLSEIKFYPKITREDGKDPHIDYERKYRRFFVKPDEEPLGEKDINNKFGISILINSRVDKNKDSNIEKLLNSALECISPEYYEKLEFLIKYDTDDDKRPKEDFFKKFPFVIKVFVYERGEGRQYNHHFSEYLFANRNPSFRWVMNMADDFFFTRKGFMEEIESIKEEFMILGFTRPTFELNAEEWVYLKTFPVNFDGLNGIGECCPLMTSNLVEIAQNMGWQPNLDAWILALEAALYRKYKILIWNQIKSFYQRGGSYGLGDTPIRKNTDIYNNMVITGARIPKNKYFFYLIEQQATNIYLNIIYGKRQPDDLALKKIEELRKTTPLIDVENQLPRIDWTPYDFNNYNNPPIVESYQIGG